MSVFCSYDKSQRSHNISLMRSTVQCHTSSAYYLFMNLAIKKPIVSALAFCRRLSGECGTPAPLQANSGLNLCSRRRWSCDRPAPDIPSDPKRGTWKRRQIQAFTNSHSHHIIITQSFSTNTTLVAGLVQHIVIREELSKIQQLITYTEVTSIISPVLCQLNLCYRPFHNGRVFTAVSAFQRQGSCNKLQQQNYFCLEGYTKNKEKKSLLNFHSFLKEEKINRDGRQM